MFKKIMVAVDGSENSYLAVDNAVGMASLNNGKVDVISVIPQNMHVWSDSSNSEYLNYRKKYYKDIHSKIAEKMKKAGVEYTSIIKNGHIGSMICEEAEKLGVDVIVIGSRGLSNVSRVILGSVSSYVAASAKCSVLIVK